MLSDGQEKFKAWQNRPQDTTAGWMPMETDLLSGA